MAKAKAKQQFKVKKPDKISIIFKMPFPTGEKQIPPWLLPPRNWIGTKAEWAVEWALSSLKIDHVYQFPIRGGRQMRGGDVADFFIPSLNLIFFVQGIYWHYEKAGVEEADKLMKISLESLGYEVVFLDEDDVLIKPLFYVKEGLEGRDHSRAMKGY